MSTVTIRLIAPADDPVVAHIVRSVLTEFGANKQGTAFADATTDHLSALFNKERAIYFVALIDNQIVGGAGIHPLDGGTPEVCELQKMYLLPECRGKGIARTLIEKCLDFARANGYTHCYLETLPELKQALRLYEYFGFQYLDGPMGATGHFGCDTWMLKTL
jgi:putative acetyltransferase